MCEVRIDACQRNFLLIAVAAILHACTPVAVAADTVVVNGATRYQTMKGWEAHARAWQVDKLRNAYDPSWKVHAPAIATRMVTELGLNRIQVPLRSGWQNPVDYWAQFVAGALSYTEWKSHNYEKSGSVIQFSEFDFLIETSVLPMATALAARGEKLYVNLGYGDFNTQGFLQGSVSFAANPAAYATFVQAFFDRLKSKYGITADALELLNEPENTAWTGTQIGQALVAAKARLVAAGYPGLNYIGPSPSSAGHMQTMANSMLAVPGAAAALTTLSYHRYDSPGASTIGALDAYAKSKGLQLDMSEWIDATADTLLEDLTVGNVASWQKWAIADRKEAGRTNPQAFYYLCDISTTPPSITMAPNTALLAQYFRYVRLGAVRVAAQSSVTARRPVAFINADGTYVVVVKTTAGTGAQAVTVSGLPAGTYGVRTTTYSGQAADQADVVAAANGTLTVTLADGITTLFGKTANPPSKVAVTEYRHAGWDHYFVTSDPDEMVKLDSGTLPGWVRTGGAFTAYRLGSNSGNPVCRFFSTSFAPRSSHFYTPLPSECTTVDANPNWILEGQVFAMPVPDEDGTCAAGTLPVYRLYNNGHDGAPNHRYTIDADVRIQMIHQGWIAEGSGPLGTIMCSPE
jgi:O-glycosyl hydrolase